MSTGALTSVDAAGAIRMLAARLRDSPPEGVSPDDVDRFFDRHSLPLVVALTDLIEAASAVPDNRSKAKDSTFFDDQEGSDDNAADQVDPTPPQTGQKLGAGEREELQYDVVIRGIWGRKRTPDTTVEPIAKGVDPRRPMTLDQLLPLARSRISEMKVRPGAQVVIQEQPVTIKTYPDSKHEILTFILGSHKTLYKEILA